LTRAFTEEADEDTVAQALLRNSFVEECSVHDTNCDERSSGHDYS
jgi:hypothetical protein